MKEKRYPPTDPGFSRRFDRIATIVLLLLGVIGGWWALSVPPAPF